MTSKNERNHSRLQEIGPISPEKMGPIWADDLYSHERTTDRLPMQQIANDGLPYFQFESFNGGTLHAVFTRLGGVSAPPFASLNMSSSVADAADHLRQNRQRAYGAFGYATETLVHAHLVHGADVARVTSAQNGQVAASVDGLITDEPGCGLAMNFADCAPILLWDPVRGAVGLGHAGWQGTVKDLPGAMVRAMMAAFGSEPETLIAGIGPCIGPCCYEVGEPVISAVWAAFEEPEALLPAQPNGPRPHFDLPAANVKNLRRAGVRQVAWGGICTACRTDLFFSHRAEKGKTGRFGVLLALRS